MLRECVLLFSDSNRNGGVDTSDPGSSPLSLVLVLVLVIVKIIYHVFLVPFTFPHEPGFHTIQLAVRMRLLPSIFSPCSH